MSPTERGSRRHVLDLLASADAPNQLDALLASAEYHLVPPLECRPIGPDSSEEYTLRAFWREHCGGWVLPEALDDWWADHYKNPTWDLIAVRSLCVDAADLDGLCIRDRCFPLTCTPAGDDHRSYRWNECPHCQGSSPL
jgi:hypothetical protein